MPRGGKRQGAGRPKKSSLSPHRQKAFQEEIQTNQILRRLFKLVMGEIEMSSPAVAAAGIMLKKILPDLAAVETSGIIETIHYGIGDQPLTEDEWNKQFVTEH
jgi:hypothetical protein